MHFLSNFGCKIIFLRFVNFCYPQHSKSLFKGSIGHVTSQCKWPILDFLVEYQELTWGTIYGQVFSVSFSVSRLQGLQGLQPSGELGTNWTVREIVETVKWKLFHSRLDIIF